MDQKPVTIYTTPTCHFCQMSKEFFKENNVTYTEFNVANDLEKRQEMIDKSGQMGVPVIFIGDDMIIGFDRNQFVEKLGLGGDAPASSLVSGSDSSGDSPASDSDASSD